MMTEAARASGVDTGGPGIKAAPVDLTKGDFAEPRLKILTLEVPTPRAVVRIAGQQLDHSEVPESASVDIAFPASIKPGQRPNFMVNLDQSWIGVNVIGMFSGTRGRSVVVVNDVDAVGLAEAQFGVARGQDDLVIATTLGTGTGTASIYNGVSIPNTEFGHIILSAKYLGAEKHAFSAIREDKELGCEKWAKRLAKHYGPTEKYFNPSLFTIDGDASRQNEKFLPYMDIKTPIVPTKLRSQTGIVDVAYYTSTKQR